MRDNVKIILISLLHVLVVDLCRVKQHLFTLTLISRWPCFHPSRTVYFHKFHMQVSTAANCKPSVFNLLSAKKISILYADACRCCRRFSLSSALFTQKKSSFCARDITEKFIFSLLRCGCNNRKIELCEASRISLLLLCW